MSADKTIPDGGAVALRTGTVAHRVERWADDYPDEIRLACTGKTYRRRDVWAITAHKHPCRRCWTGRPFPPTLETP